MKEKKIGFELNVSEGGKMTMIPMSEELKKYFEVGENEKNHIYYLEKFIGGKKNYEIARKAVEEAMKKSLPKDRKERCDYCLGKGTEFGDKLCQKYYGQMELTYFVACNEFLRIVFANKHLLMSKPVLQKLTINFFDCLHFIENEGKMFFDLEKMCRYCLQAGFLSLSKMFAKSTSLNNIRFINESLNALNDEEIENTIQQKEDENYLDLQKTFFESKRRYYKDKIFIEKEEKAIKPSIKSKKGLNNSRPNRTDIAYYCYYTSETKTLNTENTFPSDKAWLEIGKRFNKNHKNIQQAYNLILNNKAERLKKTKEKNIKFVINNMLIDNEKAQKLAKDELKLLELKS